jgi:hypothetical protein
VLIQYWNDTINPAVWVTIFVVLSVLVAVIFIGVYGEVEFFFAILKIFLVVGIVIMGLVIDLGGVPGKPRLGFHYWKTPGPFVEYIAEGSWGRFLGFWYQSYTIYCQCSSLNICMVFVKSSYPRRNSYLVWSCSKGPCTQILPVDYAIWDTLYVRGLASGLFFFGVHVCVQRGPYCLLLVGRFDCRWRPNQLDCGLVEPYSPDSSTEKTRLSSACFALAQLVDT